jgi:hypothetical protein
MQVLEDAPLLALALRVPLALQVLPAQKLLVPLVGPDAPLPLG